MGPYFISKNAPLYADVTPLARALVAAAPDRVVWSTDWPHPGARALIPQDHVLVDNPAQLYGF